MSIRELPTSVPGSVFPPISLVRRNTAMVAVLLSMLMTNIDSSIVNVALPQLSHDLNASAADTVWVTTAFLLAVASCLPAMVGLADQIGRKRAFVIGMPLFTLASLGCALAPTLSWLLVGRVVQAVGAALLFAVAIPLYRVLFPPHKLGFVLGMNAMIVALGTCVGPALGGVILAHLSWPWLFLINVPIGLLSTVLGVLAIPRSPGSRGNYDFRGAVVAAVAIALFLIGVHQLAKGSGYELGLVLLGASSTLVFLFLRIEKRAVRPVIPLHIFNSRFSLGLLAAFWSFFGQGVAFVALPFLFQTAFHASPLQSALLFTPWPLSIVIVAPISGRLADRYSTAKLSVLGLSIFTIGLLALATLGSHPPIWQVLASTALAGFGFAVFQSPNNRDIMSAAPLALAGPAAGMLNLNRTLSQSAGAAAVGMALALTGATGASIASEARAANGVLLVAVAGAAVAVIMCAAKVHNGRPKTTRLLEANPTECKK